MGGAVVTPPRPTGQVPSSEQAAGWLAGASHRASLTTTCLLVCAAGAEGGGSVVESVARALGVSVKGSSSSSTAQEAAG